MRYRLPERAGDKPNLAFVLKACPKCLGDLVLQRDLGGDYYACLQCGTEIETRPQGTATPRHFRHGLAPAARASSS